MNARAGISPRSGAAKPLNCSAFSAILHNAMGKITTVFFDAGNTLFDLREKGETPEFVRGKIYAQTARRFGCDVSDEEMTRAMEETTLDMPQRIDGAFRYSVTWFEIFIERIFARLGGVRNLRDATQTLFTYFRDPRNFYVFDDVFPALDSLKRRGVKTGVISNWSPTLPMVLHGLGLGRFFSAITVSAVVQMEKPESAIFHEAMKSVGADAEDAAHVGDSFSADFTGAKNAGMTAYLLDRRGNHPRAGETGGRLIRSLRELSAAVEHSHA
jgi:putative hydrolase of the HAD superfamily